jgi:hypothetical protein
MARKGCWLTDSTYGAGVSFMRISAPRRRGQVILYRQGHRERPGVVLIAWHASFSQSADMESTSIGR